MSARVHRAKEPWKPIEGSSQEFALMSPAHHTLYHGARGPGKTDCQLMRFYMRVGIGYGPFWRGVIFDREYKNLDDIVVKSRRWFAGHGDGAVFQAATNQFKWTWPTGEELLFRVVKKESDYWNYHGQEFPFIGWNELCKFPSPQLYDMMQSLNRSSWTAAKDLEGMIDQTGAQVVLPPIPLEVFSTANPYGPGHAWVKRRFIDPAPNGTILKKTQRVFDPQVQEDVDVTTTQVAIFGSYRENIYLSPKYVADLESQKDPNLRKAWLLGDWDIVAGGAFDDVWLRSVHVLPRFKIPDSWRIDRSFDWGSSHPFCCVWWAEANGEEAVLADGSKFCPPAGTLIAIYELYGAREIGDNKGLKWSAHRVATEIANVDKQLLDNKWIGSLPLPGPADNQIRNVNDAGSDTIEITMEKLGVRWESSDKSPGSRKIGLQLARDRLEAAKTGDNPSLYAMENCRAFVSLVPTLPRDPVVMDDVDTDAEDHVWDAIRYRVLKSANRIAMSIEFNFPT